MNEVRVNHKAAGRVGAVAGEAVRVADLRRRAIGVAQRSRQAMR
jgi:hypothetical protein